MSGQCANAILCLVAEYVFSLLISSHYAWWIKLILFQSWFKVKRNHEWRHTQPHWPWAGDPQLRYAHSYTNNLEITYSRCQGHGFSRSMSTRQQMYSFCHYNHHHSHQYHCNHEISKRLEIAHSYTYNLEITYSRCQGHEHSVKVTEHRTTYM